MNMFIFTVKPAFSSHGCTVCCKFFLNLHTTYVNIHDVYLLGGSVPGVLFFLSSQVGQDFISLLSLFSVLV